MTATAKSFLIAVFLSLVLLSAPAQEKITALRAGKLLDGSGAAPVTNAVILIQGKRILAAGAGLAIPPGAEVIDLSNRTVLPGFMDMHTHITTEHGSERVLERLSATGADYALVGAVNARRMLMAGFTTVRDLGAGDYADLAVKRAIDRGLFPGPRLFVATIPISATGGHGDATNGYSPFVELNLPTGVANGVDAVRAKVRELVKYGADQIKFMATGGALSRGDKPTAQQYSEEEMQAIIDEAHRLGVKVATHAHGNEGIKAAVRAGVDSIEHGIYLDEEACRMMIQHGTYLVPTLWIVDAFEERHKEWRLPPWAVEKVSAFIPTAKKSADMAIRMGVKIALGTDAGVGEHALSAKEFAAYVHHGMKPMDAILAGTLNAARLLGRENEMGTIGAGKTADIVAVEGDPLENIQVLETNVKFVMKEGKVYRRE